VTDHCAIPFDFDRWSAPISDVRVGQFRLVPGEPLLQVLDKASNHFHGQS
jgi:hypothetical protein